MSRFTLIQLLTAVPTLSNLTSTHLHHFLRAAENIMSSLSSTESEKPTLPALEEMVASTLSPTSSVEPLFDKNKILTGTGQSKLWVMGRLSQDDIVSKSLRV